MNDIFIHIFNMSITASWIILAVFIVRLLIRKAPKSITVCLWTLAGIRLIVPFSFESAVSLIPSTKTIPPDIIYSSKPSIHSGVTILNSTVNPIISESLAPSPYNSVNPVQMILFFATIVWIAGVIGMLLYSAICFIRIKIKISPALLLYDNVYLCDALNTPFILGIIKPKIFLPSDITEADKEFVLAHEKAHIVRKDHIWKPLAFLLVTIYWFNPVIWLGYIVFCRDVEFATDEKVIKELGRKKEYSNTLINLSSPRHIVAHCPLAFGENSVKSRIKSILSYKKPTVWIIVVAVICTIITAICFLTDPISKPKNDVAEQSLTVTDAGTTHKDIEIEFITGSLLKDWPYIEFMWTNNSTMNLEYGEQFRLYKDGKEVSSETVWNLLLYILNAGQSEYDSCSLINFDITESGSYRIEKEFSFSGDHTKYKAYIDFEVNRAYSFVGHQFKSENMIYDDGSFSSIFYTDTSSPIFCISDTDMHLLTSEHPDSPTLSSSFYDAGPLKKIALTEQNFDALTHSEIWDDGFDTKMLRENNKHAFKTEDKSANRIYYILEQNNNDIYICYGYCEPNVIRWIFKMRRADTGYKYSKYFYTESPDPIQPSILLNETEKIFTFTYSGFSSYLPYGGYYESDDNELILTTEDGKYKYYFVKQGENLIFDASRSSDIPEYKYSADATEALSPVPDGAVFKK